MQNDLKISISNDLIKTLEPRDKPYDVRDSDLTGFMVRVYPSGKKSYVVQYGRGKRYTIGSTELIKAKSARDKALILLGQAKDGIDPHAEKRKQNVKTLRDFIEKVYSPWVTANRKTGEETVKRLSRFDHLMKFKLSELTAWQIEKWRTKRLKDGVSKETINRDLNALRAALSMAVEFKHIDEHPLKGVKQYETDKRKKVRYLLPDEETRLRGSLGLRDKEYRDARENANRWRKQRGYKLFPTLTDKEFIDHLEPMVLLSINTGMRRGEVFHLRWKDIDLKDRMLTIEGSTAKSGTTRHLPLNAEAFEVLSAWKKQSKKSGLVFPGKEGEPLTNVKKAWASVIDRAKIQNFRWHDLRHDFASKLVMRGVDLNTVRELLGHADLKMTLRYAHLAPEHKKAAVDRLMEPVEIERPDQAIGVPDRT